MYLEARILICVLETVTFEARILNHAAFCLIRTVIVTLICGTLCLCVLIFISSRLRIW